MARQIIQGGAAHAVASYSFDCEVIVELTGAWRFGINPMT